MKIDHNDILEDVLPEDVLELNNGTFVKNLRELCDALKKMNKADFSLHVYGDHNDFAEWILEAYWDEDLAGKLLKTRKKKKMIDILEKILAKSKIGGGKNKTKVLKEIEDLHG